MQMATTDISFAVKDLFVERIKDETSRHPPPNRAFPERSANSFLIGLFLSVWL